jgi:hypothetical protein
MNDIPDQADRRLTGPAHAHLDGPCTDRCYESAPPVTEYDASTHGHSVTLSTFTLGLNPYVLIQAIPDGEDLRIKVDHNDTEGGTGASIALLYVLNLPAEQNPLTAAIKAVCDANRDDDSVAATLRLFADFCDIPWPEYGK